MSNTRILCVTSSILSLSFAICVFPSIGNAIPGGGRSVYPSSASAKPGGLVIDLRSAQQNSTGVDVSWSGSTNDLTIVAGSQRHKVAVDDWELNAMIDLVLANPGMESLTLSIDRVGTQNNVSVSEELTRSNTLVSISGIGAGINPLAWWLVEADLDYAGLVQSEPDSRLLPDLNAISPIVETRRLLKSDPAYRTLAQDLVREPLSWPRIEFHVGSLSTSQPVTWETEFGILYQTPHGALVDPSDATTVDPTLAPMPFAKLEHGVETDPSIQQAVRAALPTVEAAERYALTLAALSAYCPTHATKCNEWLKATAGAQIQSPPAPTAPFYRASLQSEWDATRTAMWSKNKSYLCALYIDQRTAILSGVANLAPPSTPTKCEKDEAKIIALLEDEGKTLSLAFDPTAAPDDPALHSAWSDWKKSLAALTSKKSGLAADERALWQDHSMHLMHGLDSFWVGHPDFVASVSKAKKPLLDACVDAAEADRKLAEKSPTKKKSLYWRFALGRWDHRCSPVAGARPDIVGAFHYAIGFIYAKEGERAAAIERRRMVLSCAAVMRSMGGDSGAKKLETLAAKIPI